jgi:uncharacterized phage protein gp47/JayE
MRLSDILAAVTADLQGSLGTSIDLSADTPLGQINGILSEREAVAWQGLEDLNLQSDPDFATGLNQDNLYAINNVTRLPAVASTVVLTIAGTPGTVVPGTDTSSTPFQASVAGSNHTQVFQLTQTVTIGGGGTVTANAQCTQTGPTVAGTGTITVIETPTTGVASVDNLPAATPGRNLETDTQFRIRRLNELQRSQAATNQGILDTVAQVAGVIQAGVIENDEDTTDMTTGLPPHSIEVFAVGGTDADIAQAIWNSKAAGIQTFGTTTVVVVDSQGFSHNISFSRPTQVVINIIVNITRDLDPSDGQPFPPGGAAQVQAALVVFGASAAIGQDVVNVRLMQAVMDAVTGIAELQILQAIFPAVPVSSANITIGPTEVMNIVTANITVNVT